MTSTVGTQMQIEREEVLRRAAEDHGLSGDPAVVARLLASRFSCRGFSPKPLADLEIRRLVGLAQLSASWCNTQPWNVIVTTGAGTERFRRTVFEHAAKNPPREADFSLPIQYEGVYKERRRSAAWQLYESVGITRGDRKASFRQALENYKLFGAPHMMIITSEQDLQTYGAIDCGIFLGNLMLVAQAMGIATIAQAAFAFIAPFVSAYFGLPPNRKVICGMSFGYADETHPANRFRTPRAEIDSAVTFVRS